jgi:hypothetical protein
LAAARGALAGRARGLGVGVARARARLRQIVALARGALGGLALAADRGMASQWPPAADRLSNAARQRPQP